MATYKQKPLRLQTHYASSDSEEASGSDQEWVVFPGDRSSSKSLDRKIGNPSSDDDWHVLSDNLSPTEEGLTASESNSELISDNDSEQYQAQEYDTHFAEDIVSQDYIGQMPSHDGVGNFKDEVFSDIDFTPIETNSFSTESEENHNSEAANPNITGADAFDQNQNIHHSSLSETKGRTLGSARDSLISTLRHVFRIEEEVVSLIEREQPPQVYQRLAESASANAKFELGDLGVMNPIKSLANVNNENATDHSENQGQSLQSSIIDNIPISYTRLSSGNASIITRLGSRPNVLKDPMAVKFPPTIPRGAINDILTNSHDNQATSNSQHTSQDDTNSLLSTVWTTFRRITNNIIISNDSESSHNDNTPYSSALSYGSSSHTHKGGLASIITGSGENYYTYDACYPPFGNHLTLSDLYVATNDHG
ncbi:3702_t:CDS:2 [Cetraspora pellucida]|uniref:3702_t:CDS:1 n=1 Tax=Cetraspora pellucida TaxID=1433469 RepID=A0A9N9CZ19_9GLOM|nr:3702_t:CDS:2 [Cetraspora pellucida]